MTEFCEDHPHRGLLPDVPWQAASGPTAFRVNAMPRVACASLEQDLRPQPPGRCCRQYDVLHPH